MSFAAASIRVAQERDVVVARQRARALASSVGFDANDQVRFATAVSELARHALSGPRGGVISWSVDGAPGTQVLAVRLEQAGVPRELEPSSGDRLPPLASARRLVDAFEQHVERSCTVVTLKKELPSGRSLDEDELARIAGALERQIVDDPYEELRRQNRELADALDEVTRRQKELVDLNRELEDTNRGVVALYAELDERALQLQRADDLKRRFLSNMSHEFRTPLHSVLALARLLLDRVDGPITSEQEKQVRFIDQAARGLLELVNDLLDLAKVEAGRIEVRPSDFTISEVFGALRGMLRPLLANDRLQLAIDDPHPDAVLHTDEGKVSQILRNLVANAIKYTEAGEVRVSARIEGEGASARAVFRVSDTGAGIAKADFARIFEEFGQLDTPMHRRVRGTGLGLPLSLKLARLLGGTIEVESEVGIGSAFTLAVPTRIGESAAPQAVTWRPDPERVPVLLVEDDAVDRFLVQKHLRDTRYEILPAASARDARRWLATTVPSACILDVVLGADEIWSLVDELRSNDATSALPLIFVTRTDDRERAYHAGAAAYFTKPFEPSALLAALDRCTAEWSERVRRAASTAS